MTVFEIVSEFCDRTEVDIHALVGRCRKEGIVWERFAAPATTGARKEVRSEDTQMSDRTGGIRSLRTEGQEKDGEVMEAKDVTKEQVIIGLVDAIRVETNDRNEPDDRIYALNYRLTMEAELLRRLNEADALRKENEALLARLGRVGTKRNTSTARRQNDSV